MHLVYWKLLIYFLSQISVAVYKRPSLGVAVRQKVNETISVARRLLGTGEYVVVFVY